MADNNRNNDDNNGFVEVVVDGGGHLGHSDAASKEVADHLCHFFLWKDVHCEILRLTKSWLHGPVAADPCGSVQNTNLPQRGASKFCCKKMSKNEEGR